MLARADGGGSCYIPHRPGMESASPAGQLTWVPAHHDGKEGWQATIVLSSSDLNGEDPSRLWKVTFRIQETSFLAVEASLKGMAQGNLFLSPIAGSPSPLVELVSRDESYG